MQREIKFRGKRVDDGGWVYGYYVKGSVRHCILLDLGGIDFEVIPETVGQFTGLKDSNKNDIYESDIIKSWYSRDMSGKDIIQVLYAVEFEVNSEQSGFEVPFICNSEVIGNTHDTPQLLTK